jgi:hypothetical protein
LGSVIRRVLVLLVVASIAVAVIRVFPWDNPAGVWAQAEQLGNDFSAWIGTLLVKFNVGQLPAPSEPIKLPVATSSG